MSIVYDTTGNNPLYRITDQRYRVRKNGVNSVKLSFVQSAYEDIVIKKVGSDGAVVTLVNGIDYSLTGCRDESTESLVRANHPGFSKTLYSGVFIYPAAFGSGEILDLTIEFQSVFPNILSSAVDVASNPGGPSCTPELLRSIIQDLCYVKGMISGNTNGSIVLLTSANIGKYKDKYYPVCSTVSGNYVKRIITTNDINSYVNDPNESAGSFSYSKSMALPSPLVTDYTGELADNFIEDEEHYVDTIGGKVIIRPANGAFYGDKEKIIIRNSSHQVIPSDEYTVRGLDMSATKVCENTSGVWRYIVLTTSAYTGSIYISYQAFGGEVNINNFITLQNEFIELRNYINQSAFLTERNLSGTPVLQEVFQRLKTLDYYFRSLNLSGYREMSNRYIAVPANSSSANESHWYPVAYLYKQVSSACKKETLILTTANIASYVNHVLPLSTTASGTFVDTRITNDDIGKYVIVTSAALDINDADYFTTYTKDSARFKIRLEKTGIFFDLYVYANLKNEVLKIHPVEADTENGYCRPSSYKSLKEIILPEFRLVWRTDGDYTYGAALQVKFKIPDNESNEIVHIENHNKAGMGGWVLRADNIGTDSVGPEDNTVMLPDGIHSWTSGNSSTYKSITTYPTFKDGTLIWAGCLDMNLFDSETSNTDRVSVLHSCFSGNLDFTSIENISIVVFDRYDHVYKTFTEKISSIIASGCSATFEFDPLDLSFFKLNLSKQNGNVTIIPMSILGTKSMYLHKFDLRQITINREIENDRAALPRQD